MNRRSFLKKSLLASAALLVAPLAHKKLKEKYPVERAKGQYALGYEKGLFTHMGGTGTEFKVEVTKEMWDDDIYKGVFGRTPGV